IVCIGVRMTKKGLDSKRTEQSHDKRNLETDNSYVTKEDLQRVINEFEHSIEYLEKRNSHNITMLKKSEKEIMQASKEVLGIKTKLSLFFTHIESELGVHRITQRLSAKSDPYQKINLSIVTTFL